MNLPSVFDASTTELIRHRLDKLSADTIPLWGKMNAAQMLGHLNIGYDIASGKIPTKYNWFMKLMLGWFVKPMVIGDKPYTKNSQTAPVFIVSDERNFEAEKAIFLANVERMQQEGAAAYEGKVSNSFGKMTSNEWSRQFYKHTEHHFSQFGI